MSGHESYRERRCGRCLDHGIVVIERQARGYYGGKVKGEKWQAHPIRRTHA